MSELKSGLKNIFGMLKDLETKARNLKNQNFAGIAASAHGKIKQLHDHADLELIEEKPVEGEQLSFDPNAGDEPKAPHSQPQSQPRPLGPDEYPRS